MTTQQELSTEVAARLRQLAAMVEKSDAHIVTFTVRAELDRWRVDISLLCGTQGLKVPQVAPYTSDLPPTLAEDLRE